LLSTEDEELPCWNGRDKETGMVPSVNFMKAIWVIPLFLFEIELHDVVKLHFRVPSTINEDFTFTGKSGMATSSFRRVVAWNNLFPLFGLKIEAVEIVESNSRVAETSMSSEKINLTFIEYSRGVCSWRWSTDSRFSIASIIFFGTDSSPYHGFSFEKPGIV
jgi:hypothetical protein